MAGLGGGTSLRMRWNCPESARSFAPDASEHQGIRGLTGCGKTAVFPQPVNAKIQWIKYQARGFRNEGRFQRAILFHCAGLDLYPAHSNS